MVLINTCFAEYLFNCFVLLESVSSLWLPGTENSRTYCKGIWISQVLLFGGIQLTARSLCGIILSMILIKGSIYWQVDSLFSGSLGEYILGLSWRVLSKRSKTSMKFLLLKNNFFFSLRTQFSSKTKSPCSTKYTS